MKARQWAATAVAVALTAVFGYGYIRNHTPFPSEGNLILLALYGYAFGTGGPKKDAPEEK